MILRPLVLAAALLWSAPALALELDALWDYGNPALSEQRFTAALNGASSNDAFLLRTQIARTHGLRGQFERQREVLAALKPLLEDASAEARTRYFLELGRSYASAAHKPSEQTAETRALATAAFGEAIRTARAAQLDGLQVDALHMMEFAETAPDARMRWVREALAVASASTQPTARRWEASLRNNLGYALHDLGRHDEALKEFEAALKLREAQGQPEGIRVARWMVAWTLRSLGRHTEALAIQLRLEQERAEAKRPSPYVYGELAELYRLLGDADKARHYAALKQQLEAPR